MKNLLKITSLLLITCLAGTSFADHQESDRARIDAVLDDFHDAAAKADADRYLGHLTDDAVFMGTDEWERWPKHPDFADYVTARFADGGWSYRSVGRQVQVADDIAWFDEVIFSESNGRFRGTGVLVKSGGDWKIAHYAMSFLVFNEDWQEVIELTRRTRAEKEAN
jgi:ketosteroid isomerase-like protein